MNHGNLSLSYQDIYLIPQYSTIKSRSQVSTEVKLFGKVYAEPFLPSNMVSCIDINIAYRLQAANRFYIMHRFCDIRNFIKIANEADWDTISISIGVKQQDKDIINWAIDNEYRIDIITIDVAHGHHELVQKMIRFIRKNYNRANIIAGNIATSEAAIDLALWGANAVKVGIAGGMACSTKNQTGFHIPMFSCVREISGAISIPIIADGGVRENGDFAKALAAGATMVMAGSIFASCIDSPAENVYESDTEHKSSYAFGSPMELVESSIEKNRKIVGKRYFGSASERQKGSKKNVEGFEVDLKCNGFSIDEKYSDIREALQSSCSYAGISNTNSLSIMKNRFVVINK